MRRVRRYCIRYQWRNPKGCQGNPRNWKSWRIFASLPILFCNSEDAWNYIKNHPNIFMNLDHVKKPSVSVNPVIVYR